MSYNYALNGIYNPLTAQAIAGSFNTTMMNRANANASGILDYSTNAMTNSIANNSGLNAGLMNFDPYSATSGYGFCGVPGMGCGMGYGMGMYGYGPGSEVMGMTQADYMRYQENLQNQQIDMQTRTRRKLNVADYQASAGEKAVKERIEILKEQILQNNQDNVMSAYGSLKEAVANHLKASGYMAPNGISDEENLKAQTNHLFEQVTGMSIPRALQTSGDTHFVHGLKQGALCGIGALLTNKRSAGENAAEITGTPVTKSEKAWNIVGMVTSAIATTGLALVALPLLARGGKAGGTGIGSFVKNQWAKVFR